MALCKPWPHKVSFAERDTSRGRKLMVHRTTVLPVKQSEYIKMIDNNCDTQLRCHCLGVPFLLFVRA
eukprot:4540992-Amphidinium_carterae.1